MCMRKASANACRKSEMQDWRCCWELSKFHSQIVSCNLVRSWVPKCQAHVCPISFVLKFETKVLTTTLIDQDERILLNSWIISRKQDVYIFSRSNIKPWSVLLLDLWYLFLIKTGILLLKNTEQEFLRLKDTNLKH